MRAVGEDGGRDVHGHGVDEDHGEHRADDAPVPDDEVKARVEDEGLARDHGVPADGDDGHCDLVYADDTVELEHKADGVQRYAPYRRQHEPEIQASPALEGHVCRHVEFEDVVPGNAGQGGQCHVYGQAGVLEVERVVGRAVFESFGKLAHVDSLSVA